MRQRSRPPASPSNAASIKRPRAPTLLPGPSIRCASRLQVKDAPKPAFALRAYRALTHDAAPVAPLLLAWRTRIGKEEPARRAERYGEASMPRPSGFLAWFHAASVGEANAVLPVIDAIAAEHPEIRLLLTTGTVTSAKLARARLPKGAVHQYVPLDNQDYVRRFLDHWRPDLAVFVESEIWPNLVLETKALNVPLVLVNGRMSFRSFRRWRNRPGLSRPLFSAFDLVLAQNERFAQRFTAARRGRAPSRSAISRSTRRRRRSIWRATETLARRSPDARYGSRQARIQARTTSPPSPISP